MARQWLNSSWRERCRWWYGKLRVRPCLGRYFARYCTCTCTRTSQCNWTTDHDAFRTFICSLVPCPSCGALHKTLYQPISLSHPKHNRLVFLPSPDSFFFWLQLPSSRQVPPLLPHPQTFNKWVPQLYLTSYIHVYRYRYPNMVTFVQLGREVDSGVKLQECSDFEDRADGTCMSYMYEDICTCMNV